MTRNFVLAWLLVAVWAAWLFAAQGALAAHVARPEWVPDLGLVLLLSMSARISKHDVPKAALAVAIARCAVSIDPPVAILAGYGAVVLLAQGMRRVFDTSSAVPGALLAGASAALVHAWLVAVHEVRLHAELARSAEVSPQAVSALQALVHAWPTALSSALVALIAGGVLGQLPGTSVLVRRREWHVAASSR